MKRRVLFPSLALSLLAAGAAVTSGCGGYPEWPPPQPPEVTVARPVTRDVVEYSEFTGRTDAVELVEVRARVTGYLDKILFTPGSEVKPGDELFQIDPRSYQAELDKAEGQVTVAQARLDRLTQDLQRNRPLAAKGTISPAEFDKIVGDREEAAATLKSAKATAAGARLNRTLTLVTSPIKGRVGRPLVTEGNLVSADNTVVTTIVSQDTVYAYFDIDENTMLRYEKQVREGKITPREKGEGLALLRLANEEGYPHRGRLDFMDSQLSRTTGTITARLLFPNADRTLKAGEFVQIRIPMGDPAPALLIPETAVGSDQGQKYVFVVDDQNKVGYRRVKLGAVYDGLQVVTDGLKPEEWVIVNGIQFVRDGVVVVPKRAEQPQAQK